MVVVVHVHVLVLVVLVVLAMMLLSFASPFIFGRARLDVARTSTHLPIFVMLGVFVILRALRDRRVLFAALPLVSLLAFAVRGFSGDEFPVSPELPDAG